ncbi:MFS transporter [Nonomuraea sp. NBC_01738]|uniref:MFS transporter n=1 Tax=Nonomuraea sp. NBC_01738 TaxID=2976003 RepID=UPI002E12009C|nr:MFS transporter [Nonomuraea sp. NBC_01738]
MPFRAREAVLWRDPDFRRLWLGQSASQVGAQAGLVTLPLVAMLVLGADAWELGLLRAVEQLPILLFSLLAGALVDRGRARDIMVLTDAGRALALAVVPVVLVLGLPALLVVGFLVGALGVFFDVAYQAALVRIVPGERLTRANSALEGSRSAAQIGGPALGGTLVSVFSAPFAAVAGAFFFAVSFLAIRRMREVEPASGGRGGIWAGVRLVAGHRVLRAVGIASALFQFALAAVMTVYLVFLTQVLRLPGAGVGVALAMVGPGALAGSLVAARLPGRFGYGAVLVGSAFLADGVLLVVPALSGPPGAILPVLMAVNFVFGLFGQIVDVSTMAVRQAVTPLHLQGRVVATINLAGMGLTPVGSLAGGLLAGAWGPRTGLLLAASALALSPVFMALSPLARLRLGWERAD